MEIGQRVKIAADDKAFDKGFKSKFVGQCGTVIGFKPNRYQPNLYPLWSIPRVKLDDGKIVCDEAIWYQKIELTKEDKVA